MELNYSLRKGTRPNWILIGTFSAMAAMTVLAGLFLTGCATKPDGTGGVPAPNCAELSRIVALYDASVASGVHTPSKDEERAALAARTLIAVYCSAKSGPQEIGKIPLPPETKTLTVDGTKYRLVVPFRILDTQGESVFRGRRDITEGPLYARVKPRGELPDARDACTYIPDAPYLTREARRPKFMHPLGCR